MQAYHFFICLFKHILYVYYVAGRILGVMKEEAKPCPRVAYSLPERREMVTKGKSKPCWKRDGSKWQGEKYSQEEEREGDGEQRVFEGRMVRRLERGEQGNSALFGGSTFYFIFYLFWSIVALQCCIVSAIQQSEPAIYIYTYPLFWGDSLPL